jgi:hypothetical protein
MADLTTLSVAPNDAGAKKKPEKPDEEMYSAELKKAEKEHAEAKAKFVCYYLPFPIHTLSGVTLSVDKLKFNLGLIYISAGYCQSEVRRCAAKV